MANQKPMFRLDNTSTRELGADHWRRACLDT